MPSLTIPPPPLPSDLPWLTVMLNELVAGVKETPGPKSTARINRYHAATAAGIPPGDGDETSWCSSCMCFCLEESGIRSTRSKRARSYEEYGVTLIHPRRGAIAVLERGPDPRDGHVGLVLHWTTVDVWLAGGNQGNAVSVGRFPRRRVLTYRLPPGVEISEVA